MLFEIKTITTDVAVVNIFKVLQSSFKYCS